jgi:hypothetical protein
MNSLPNKMKKNYSTIFIAGQGEIGFGVWDLVAGG